MVNDIKAMDVGDVIESNPLFKGVTDEPINLVLAEIEESPEGNDKTVFYDFDMFYFGVHLGTAIASIKNNKLIWL